MAAAKQAKKARVAVDYLFPSIAPVDQMFLQTLVAAGGWLRQDAAQEKLSRSAQAFEFCRGGLKPRASCSKSDPFDRGR